MENTVIDIVHVFFWVNTPEVPFFSDEHPEPAAGLFPCSPWAQGVDLHLFRYVWYQIIG